MRRALVIGLGSVTGGVLTAIQAYFAARQAGDCLHTLWLPPMPPPEPVHHALDLTLTHPQLSDLYFQPEVRAWSGPNWRDWKKSILSNRLFGRLALYAHRQAVGSRIVELIGDLNRVESRPLNLYVLAPLHDPFASGAFLDLAYILDRLALSWNGHVYGILFLPDTSGDPLMSLPGVAEPDPAAVSLHYATAYAALRELNFALSACSFYQSHHPEPVFRVDVRNESPFQTGDCYLLGGYLDESRRNVNWDVIVQDTARWVYLQTVTPLLEQVTASDLNRSVVSSFGVLSEQEVSAKEVSRRTAEITSVFLQHVLNAATEVAAADAATADMGDVPLNVQVEFDPRLSDAGYDEFFRAQAGLTPPARRLPVLAWRTSNQAEKALAALDVQHVYAVDLLREAESQQGQAMQAQLTRAERILAADLESVRTDSGLSVAGLEAATRSVLAQAGQTYRQGRAELERTEHEAALAAEQLREARLQFFYAGIPYPFLQTLVLPAALVVLLVAALLLAAGLPVSGLLWLALGLALPAAIMAHIQGRRFRAAQQNFIDTQRQLLTLQQRLVSRRTVNAYQHHLVLKLRDMLSVNLAPEDGGASEGVLRMEYIRSQFEALLDRLQSDRVRPSPELEAQLAAVDPWQEVGEAVVGRLWACLERGQTLSPSLVEDEIARVIEQHVLPRVAGNEKETLRALVGEATAYASTLLATNDTLIDEHERRPTVKIVGLTGWSKAVISALADDLRGDLIRLVDLTQEAGVPETGGSGAGSAGVERRLVVMHLRNNIPVRAVLNLEQWRTAYRTLYCTPERLTYRGLLHPTRSGIASSDIRVPRFHEVENLPMVLNAFCVLMHLFRSPDLEEALCQRLDVEYRPHANYDELCGALQERPEVLLEQTFPSAAWQEKALGVPDLQAVWDDIRRRKPRVSENYADWEVWTLDFVAEALEERRIPRSLQLLANLLGVSGLWKVRRKKRVRS